MLDIELEESKVENVGQKVKTAQRKRLKDAGDKGFAFSEEVVPEDNSTLRMSGFEPEWVDAETLQWGYRADHAKPTEFGTQPFHPPLQPLLEWSERVTGDKGLGYYVALEKIPTEGIDAQPYARPGRNVMKRYLQSHSHEEYLRKEL